MPVALNLAELALASSRLRKVAADEVRDSSCPALTGVLDQAVTTHYQDAVLDINIEQWLPALSEHTFRTRLVPITVDDARLFVECYRCYRSYERHGTAEHRASRARHADAEPAGPEFVLPPQLRSQADRLASRLQEAFDAIRAKDAGAAGTGPVFVKSSCRSAKDAPTSQRRLARVYAERLAARRDPETDNAKIVALLQAGLELLKVSRADDALQLFLRSERIYQDMLLALERAPERWHESFAVRQWVDIDVDLEFRGFVCNGALTALSQYNHLAYFPRLVTEKHAIAARIHSFFETEIKALLAPKFERYVIDFALTHGAAADGIWKVWVIELNPFLDTTDGCLFSWTKERALLEGRAAATATSAAGVDRRRTDGVPFEFRVLDRPRRGARSLLAADWRALVDPPAAAAYLPG